MENMRDGARIELVEGKRREGREGVEKREGRVWRGGSL